MSQQSDDTIAAFRMSTTRVNWLPVLGRFSFINRLEISATMILGSYGCQIGNEPVVLHIPFDPGTAINYKKIGKTNDNPQGSTKWLSSLPQR